MVQRKRLAVIGFVVALFIERNTITLDKYDLTGVYPANATSPGGKFKC
ncbi:MAG: hypothetical protein GTO24_02745 [candidate division Zixibacteria bacterium]|nr:hypothetical protein [candidate division Zixibacteria bacterium]